MDSSAVITETGRTEAEEHSRTHSGSARAADEGSISSKAGPMGTALPASPADALQTLSLPSAQGSQAELSPAASTGDAHTDEAGTGTCGTVQDSILRASGLPGSANEDADRAMTSTSGLGNAEEEQARAVGAEGMHGSTDETADRSYDDSDQGGDDRQSDMNSEREEKNQSSKGRCTVC